MSNHRNEGVFVVLWHSFHPIPRQADVRAREQCEFVDRISNRHLRDATAIIDLREKKIIKNRATGATFERYIEHITESYPKEFSRLLEVTGLTSEYTTETTKEGNETEQNDEEK